VFAQVASALTLGGSAPLSFCHEDAGDSLELKIAHALGEGVDRRGRI
jgi:hypothetical protein